MLSCTSISTTAKPFVHRIIRIFKHFLPCIFSYDYVHHLYVQKRSSQHVSVKILWLFVHPKFFFSLFNSWIYGIYCINLSRSLQFWTQSPYLALLVWPSVHIRTNAILIFWLESTISITLNQWLGTANFTPLSSMTSVLSSQTVSRTNASM